MTFSYIKFKNYRCFLDGEVDFRLPKNTPPERNVILFSAENGGGKTQLMFAFRFALYGLSKEEFRSIQGQSATPYALNQNLYEALKKGSIGTKEEASVELAFSYDTQKYTIRRTHVFRRSVSGVTDPVEKVVLYIQNQDGDTISSEVNPDFVKAKISKIIPEKTLYALLCDGERVRQLSSTGNETNNAIKAIVQRMTENDLLDSAYLGLSNVLRTIRRQIRSSAIDPSSCVDESVIEEVEANIGNLKKQVEFAKGVIAKTRTRLAEISEDLKQITAVKEKEQHRQDQRQLILDTEQELTVAQKKFIETLNEKSYWGLADRLTGEVANLLEDNSLRFPGLQADVVATILKGDKCICGGEIGETVRKVLEDLRLHLPPINIDAELSSVLHQYGNDEYRCERRKGIAERLRTMSELQEKIERTQDVINSISKEIEASFNPNASSLEEENKKCLGTLEEYTRHVVEWENELKESQERHQAMTRQYEELVERTKRGGCLKSRLSLIQGALKGIELIKEYRLSDALERINRHLTTAFKTLRSKSDEQRQIYITMFQGLNRLVVYHEHEAEIEYEKQISPQMNEEEKSRVREIAILAHEESNSMGQQKMASLAFMRSILEYVKDIARNDCNMRDATYPIVVDAPFGDIKRENYYNAVNCMHLFSHQVILLLADEGVPEGVAPYVAKNYAVVRRHDAKHKSNYSKIYLVGK